MKTNNFFCPCAIGALLLCTIITSGCEKYLDYPYNNAIQTPADLSDLQAMLDDAGGAMNDNRTPSFGETSADDYFCLPERYASLASWPQQSYIWKSYDYRYPNDWSLCYLPVYNSNYSLETLDKIERDNNNAKEWDNVKGSAHFFRAYYFLMLAWTFTVAYDAESADTDKGIVLRTTANHNDPSMRSTVADSYKQILDDAKQAVPLLPDLPIHPYRPSRTAAYGLLARVYLSMRVYDSAFHYANLGLQLKNDLIDFNGDADIINLANNYPFKRFNKETVFYTEMNTTATYFLILASRARIDSSLMGNYEPNDLRRVAFFTRSGNYYQYKGSYTQASRCFTGITTAELLLIRAEAAARTGNSTLALSGLNNLLSKRYKKAGFIPVQSMEQQDLVDRILLERRKELIFRGLRWMDIKRLNKEGYNIELRRFVEGNTYTLMPNSSYYALPIPKDIIDMTGIPQN